VKRRHSSEMQTTDRDKAAAAEYAREHADELARLARTRGLELLGYLFDIAAMHAAELSADGRKLTFTSAP